MREMFTTALATIGVMVALLAFSAPSDARSFKMGLFDPLYVSTDPGARIFWLDRTVPTRAGTVRINVTWSGAAPNGRPANPRNPLDPAYNWVLYDSAVKEARARGLRVLLSFSEAPWWAEGPNRPSSAPPGVWKPRPDDVADFAYALALRYSGLIVDPARPTTKLPRVRHFQVWNEPNLNHHFSPQWTKRNGRLRSFSPGHYRVMLTRAYRAIKHANRGSVVLSAGLGPFGDPGPGGGRIPPARFAREMMCLNSKLRRVKCRIRARFDAFAQHLYPSSGPTTSAFRRNDVKVPDVRSRIGRPLKAAVRQRSVLPARRKGIWVTEIGWDTKPPYPYGVSASRHARWLEQAMYLLWRQRLDTVLWFRIRDAATASVSRLSATGLVYRDGRSKPAFRAFRFPFVTDRVAPRRIRFWGKAPTAGRVRIQRRVRGGWRTFARDRTGASRIFTGTKRLGGAAKLRARIGDDVSLNWKQRK